MLAALVMMVAVRYGLQPVRDLAGSIGELRENNLALLKSVPENLWQNCGMHQERGQESITHIVRMFAGYDLNHLQQIEKIVKESRR